MNLSADSFSRSFCSRCGWILACLFILLSLQWHQCHAKVTISNIGSHFAPVVQFAVSPKQFNPIENATLVLAESHNQQGGSATTTEFVGFGWDNGSFSPSLNFLRGAIVIVYDDLGLLQRVRRWIDAGIAAVIFAAGPNEQFVGIAEYSHVEEDQSFIKIPACAVEAAVITAVRAEYRAGNVLRATLDDTSGPTPWRVTLSHPAFFVFSVIEALLSLSVCAVAGLKIRSYIQADLAAGASRLEMKLPYACLILEIIGALERFIYWGTDPLSARQLIPYLGHIPLRTLSLPFTLASTLLLTFYWFETCTNQSMSLSLNIEKLRIPCYILLAIMFGVEVIVDAMYIFNNGGSAGIENANAALYLIISLALSIFFIVTSTKIMLAIHRIERRRANTRLVATPGDSSSSQTSKKPTIGRRKTQLLRIAIKMSITGVSLLVLVVCAGMFILRNVAYRMTAWVILWWLGNTAMNFKALSTILAFTPRKPDGSNDYGSSSTKSTMSKSRTVKSSVLSHNNEILSKAPASNIAEADV